ncbi:MAG: TRAM domain-containing protein, partial [Vulcanococcus sp.]
SELVIALRPEVQPGDSLQLKIVREGKEADQGVGYLEDGTMVVVEEARKRLGERLAVTVTGALQTPTGRMVFGRLDGAEPLEPATGRARSKSSAKRSTKGDQDKANPR